MSKFEVIMPNVIAEQPIKGATESFEWLTDIIESRDGREHRVMLRSLPRVTLVYSFIAHPHNRNYYLNLLRNNLTDIWLIPNWLRAVYVGRINKGTTIVENHFDNHTGDNLLIYQDSTKNEVAKWLRASEKKSLEFVFHNERQPKLEFIFSNPTDDGKLGLSPTTNDYQAAYLLLLQKCYLNNAAYKTSGFDAQVDVTLEVVEPPIYREPTIPKNIYLDIEVLHNNYGVNESVLNKDIDIVDYGMGKITRIDRWERTKQSRSINFYLDGFDEIKKFKEFIYRRAGSLNPFWLCDGDVNICGKVRGNQIIIRDSHYDDLPSFKYLSLFHDNAISYARIISVSNSAHSNIIITIDKTIEQPVNKISFMMLCRFNTDKVQIEYDTNQQAKSDIPVIEVFDDQYF
ncbi:hypothetical protein [Gilliamella sp. Pas-s25]|uniref:hypothetical protein n=1 Tax=Gilliamella sp. Pas-s25 TaxID=2687310 RepID=UPI00135D9E61|nr:hypothetical protein [Gilliamella sp. Pas-s25]MWP63225.1 hypothetical protein [Gilliamella sp. Pas-s25]